MFRILSLKFRKIFRPLSLFINLGSFSVFQSRILGSKILPVLVTIFQIKWKRGGGNISFKKLSPLFLIFVLLLIIILLLIKKYRIFLKYVVFSYSLSYFDNYKYWSILIIKDYRILPK